MGKESQRYISKELTHFIGKGKQLNSQYRLLIRILKEGWLTHPPHNHDMSAGLIIRPSAKISNNEMYSPEVVCFCDIPVEDLTIHTQKYSKFGISFTKDFIIKRGGAPVHYLPLKSQVRELINISVEEMTEFTKPDGGEHLYKIIDKGDYFDEVVRRYNKLFRVLHKLIFESLKASQSADSVWNYPKDSDGFHDLEFPQNALGDFKSHLNNYKVDPVKDAIWYDQQLSQFERFLNFHIFSFLKFFDHHLSEDHLENYYFEREWRVIGNIQFTIDDIRRVLIPEIYSKQFRHDYPNYYGQVTFIN
jgi:hypothetical protein